MPGSARLLVFALVLVTVSAGCLGGGGNTASSSESGEEREEAPASSGQEGSKADAPERSPRVKRYDGDWLAGVYAGGLGANFVGSGHPVAGIAGNVTGVVVEVVWNATTPASSELRLEIQPSGGTEVVAEATGTSPIHVPISGSELPGPGEYVTEVRAGGDPGVFVRQSYDVYVAVFDGVPFEQGYSTVGG